MDVAEQAGRRGVRYAASKGLAVVVMEPLRGGMLSKAPPEPVARVWASAPGHLRPVEWAFRWVWDQPEVSVALSGMSTMEQVVENLAIADRCGVGIVTEAEKKLYQRARQGYRSLTPVPCTSCRYCLPCPNKVDIPRVFQLYNDATMYDDFRAGRFAYNGPFAIAQDQRADQCQECGECLEKCPQKIEIPGWLKKAHAALYEDRPPPG